MNEIDAKILWISDYYDGPLNGMCLYNERLHWFEIDHEKHNDGIGEWEYLIYELNDAETRELVTEHFRFELYVGNYRHCLHIDSDINGLKPRDTWRQFYDTHESIAPALGKTPIGVMR